jgi:predicted lactoylglutathione lyase
MNLNKQSMHTKKIWANVGVTDLDRTINFYTHLGFKPNGKPNSELASFLFGDDNFVIHFFIQKSLQKGMKGNLADLALGNEIIFTLAAQTIAEVDSWAQAVPKAGGTVVSDPEEFGEGYYGFVFADPDGHKFNVFYMEGL